MEMSKLDFSFLKEMDKMYRNGDAYWIFEKTCPTIEYLTDFLKQEMSYDDKTQCYKGVIGLSGGLDSAVVAALATKAIGKENVYGIMMPSDTNQSIDLEYAKKQAEQLGIKYDIVPIDKIEKAYIASELKYFDGKLQRGNLKARIRMSLLFDKAKQVGGMVLGTSNRSEFMTGYFTKFGDGAADIEPIMDFYKTQIRKIAKELDVPKEIIDRKPTAGLYEGQTDEGEMGITYENLDKVLLGLTLRIDNNNISKATGIHEKDISMVMNMVKRNEHKRNPPKSPGKYMLRFSGDSNE